MSSQPSQRANPPPEPEFDEMSYAHRIQQYWKTYRPKGYREMLLSGKAEESFRKQGERAQELKIDLIQDGLELNQINEIVNDQAFPMSEEEQPDLTSPPLYAQENQGGLEEEEYEESVEPEQLPPPEATT